ncbi:MAG: YggS family pyridoxal phosphate-dependent enzyme [Candidatus Spyradosoma sp.]
MISFEEFSENCARVRARVAEACAACGRDPADVTILPVTKNHPVAAPLYAARAGFAAVGENRVQEAVTKKREFADAAPAGTPAPRWELIGHLQSNKARHAAENFDRVQSVDSVALARKLDRICGEIGRERLPILLQANAGSDPAKFGTTDFDALRALAEAALAGTRLRLDGLMCVAPVDDDSLETARRCFDTLREWRDRLEDEFGVKLPELSMGMSHDLAPAVAAGSTTVRVGTALFGARDYGAKG